MRAAPGGMLVPVPGSVTPGPVPGCEGGVVVGRARNVAWSAGALVLLLGGCDTLATDETPERVKDGRAELGLAVTGHPTPGSLAATEHVLARLRARDAEGLARRAEQGGRTQRAAEEWVERWGDAAQHTATADFGPDGKAAASVAVRFSGAPAPMTLLLAPEDEDDPYNDRFVVVLGDDGAR
ncbi:hypothetical protein [Streptomyces lavendulocolor]|uniref:hypothetical protein n=1 Tax=Streptomyces lavendulocolor TaxID=67316 RepID=UPI003C2BD0B8